jgi:hypothetical protein
LRRAVFGGDRAMVTLRVSDSLDQGGCIFCFGTSTLVAGAYAQTADLRALHLSFNCALAGC